MFHIKAKDMFKHIIYVLGKKIKSLYFYIEPQNNNLKKFSEVIFEIN